MLLLPDYNPRYEDISDDKNFEYTKQAEAI